MSKTNGLSQGEIKATWFPKEQFLNHANWDRKKLVKKLTKNAYLRSPEVAPARWKIPTRRSDISAQSQTERDVYSVWFCNYSFQKLWKSVVIPPLFVTSTSVSKSPSHPPKTSSSGPKWSQSISPSDCTWYLIIVFQSRWRRLQLARGLLQSESTMQKASSRELKHSCCVILPKLTNEGYFFWASGAFLRAQTLLCALCHKWFC